MVLFRDGIGGVRRECVRSIGRAPRVEPEAAGILSRVHGNADQSDGFAEVLGACGPAVRTEWTRHAGARPFGGKPGEAIIVSAVCAIAVVAWTLLYFRPTIERFLTGGGGNTPPERLQVEARRWIGLNWVRVGLIAISWWGALITLASHE